jgi:hypothetical protein
MWTRNSHPHGTTASDLDQVIAQRDALFALAEATAELLSRWSVSAGDMLRDEAARCLAAGTGPSGRSRVIS